MPTQLDEQTSAQNTKPLSPKTGNNNALIHGGTSQKPILPGENRIDFEVLLEGLQTEYQPATQQHHLFVEQLAMGHWFLWRRQRACNVIEAAVYDSAANEPELLNEDHFRRLTLAERYKVAAERALKRAFANAESIRTERKHERDYRERHAHWQAEQELRERRLSLPKEIKSAQRKRQGAERQSSPGNPPSEAPVICSESRRPGEASAAVESGSTIETNAIRFAKNAFSSPTASQTLKEIG